MGGNKADKSYMLIKGGWLRRKITTGRSKRLEEKDPGLVQCSEEGYVLSNPSLYLKEGYLRPEGAS